MGNHARLAPSSMGRLMRCSGSLAMQELHPEPPDCEAAIEGQTAHWAGAVILRDGVVGVGEICPETNIPVDDEMLAAAEMYAAIVNSRGHFADLHVEEPVMCTRIHPEMWGTPDAWKYSAKVLNVFDFKYGHAFVEVFENWQLISYAAGILDKLGVNGYEDQEITVSFVIVQPRSYHRDGPVRTWNCKASDLRGHFNLLAARCVEALDLARAACTPEPSACRDCSARHACEALQRASLVAVEQSTSAVPFDLPPVAVGHELRTMQRAADLLKARLTGLEEQARSMLAGGKTVPFYHLEPGRGRTVWTMPDADVIVMGRMMNVNLAKPPAAITPTQAKNSTSMDAALVASLCENRKGELKVTPDDALATRRAFAG